MERLIDSIYDAQVKALENDPYIASKMREAELNDITISDTILGELSALGGPKPVPTTPVKQMSYPDLSSFLRMNPEWMDTAVEIQKNEDLSDRDLIEFMTSNFNGVGGDTKSATGKTPYLSTLGNVTGIDGSPLWKWGLDIDLKKGDPVKSPVSGKVLAVANNGGFGKQVKVRGADGNEYWFSHLDGYSVKVGDTINKGQVVGLGGNTGKTIALGGGDGSHLDLTVKDKNGNYIPPRQIKSLLDNILV
jgi:biotin carboxyl carrier protein